MADGILFILSGPSGCGKGTVCKQLLKRNKQLQLSISVTTREARSHEKEGINYFFKSQQEFQNMIENNMLLEWATFCNNSYGTPREYVTKQLAEGKDVMLEIEVQGALQVKSKFPEAKLIFLMPPSLIELRKRIEQRGTETENIIDMRLKRAEEEVQLIDKYDYIVLNDSLDEAVNDVLTVMRAEHLRASRKENTI